MSAPEIAQRIIAEAVDAYSTEPFDLEKLGRNTAETLEQLAMVVSQSLLVEVDRYDAKMVVTLTALAEFVTELPHGFERHGEPTLFLFDMEAGGEDDFAEMMRWLFRQPFDLPIVQNTI